MKFAENLRFLRKQKNLSQDYIAEIFNYKNYTTIQKWETGKAEPDLEIVHKLAKFFNVSMDDLVNKDLSIAENQIHSSATVQNFAANLGKVIKEENESLLRVLDKVCQLSKEDLVFVEKIADSCLNKKD